MNDAQVVFEVGWPCAGFVAACVTYLGAVVIGSLIEWALTEKDGGE